MKVALYFGSFNPVHIGHLIVANHAINETDINQVWFIVSPQNPFKNSASLLNEYQRLHLIRSAIDGEKNLAGAYLKDAYLFRVDLSGANLSGANLTDAIVYRPTTKGVDFDDWIKRGGIVED